MKIKDPETGNVFDEILDAWADFIRNCDNCVDTCRNCKTLTPGHCNAAWVSNYTVEAAKLMGYVVEPTDEEEPEELTNEEVNMDHIRGPLRDWTLAEARAECSRRSKTKDGCIGCPLSGICKAEPKEWNIVSLTDSEIAICKAAGAKWVSLDNSVGEHALSVTLWEKEPKYMDGRYKDGNYIGYIYYSLFPSVRPGDLVEVQ